MSLNGDFLVNYEMHAALSLAVAAALALAFWLVLRPTLPRRLLSPSLRHALWWLICLRSLLGLFPIPPITLHLPGHATRLIAPARHAIETLPAAFRHENSLNAAATSDPTAPLADSQTAEDLSTPPSTHKVSFPAPAPLVWSPAIGIGVVWLAGALLILLRMRQGTRRVRRLMENSVKVDSVDTIEALREMCRKVNVREPHMRLSSEIESPLTIGGFRPALLLPSDSFLIDPTSLQAILAHELAHIRRRDLLLSVVPALCRILLWFLPTVWLAARECELSAEEDCDLTAARIFGGDASGYVETLLKFASSSPNLAFTPTQVGFSQTYRVLRRRVIALNLRKSPLPPIACVAGGCAAALLTLLALPNYSFARAIRKSAVGVLAPEFTLTDLGPTRADASAALAIDDQGDILGDSAPPTRAHIATLWQDGRPIALPLPRRYRSSQAVGESGRDILINAYNYGRFRHAALIDSTNTVTPLAAPRAYPYSTALSADDNGHWVGYVYAGRHYGQLRARAVVWSRHGVTDLGDLGGKYSAAYGIAPNGWIVGKADTASGETHAFAESSASRPTDLGTLTGSGNSAAYAISASGEVVGYSDTTAPTVTHAALWPTVGDSPIDLGALDPGGISKARAVNSTGQIVGVSTDSNGNDARATLWENGSIYDLATRTVGMPKGWTLRYATGINSHGQIVGVGQLHGKTHAFLLTPAHSAVLLGAA